VHGVFNILILLGALAWTGLLNSHVALHPIMLAPIVLFALGISWFLAAWGVFIKDMSQIVPPFVQMAMFLSPVLYPTSAVPEAIRTFYSYNPLGAVIEACRAAALGQSINWSSWSGALVLSIIITGLGLAFFRHNREEFADAL